MHPPAQYPHRLDTVHHSALNLKPLTRHCLLYSIVGWPSLCMCRLGLWYIYVYKAFLYK